MRLAAIIALLLVIALVSLSSYLRLDQSGVGCTPWPECYGNIGSQTDDASPEQAYERLVSEARQPTSWARPAHRLIASVLGIVVLGLTIVSLMQGRQQLLHLALLGLTVFLAWLGIYSEGLHSPAIVMGNLAGGFAMLGLIGWSVFDSGEKTGEKSDDTKPSGNLRVPVTAAILVLSLQIFIGGLTSANFAASACQTLPHCFGQWIPGEEVWDAFDLSRPVEVDSEGVVIGGAERAAIHMLHRILSVFTVALVLSAAIQAIRFQPKFVPIGAFLCVLVVVEMSLGFAAIRSGIPISIAVMHNWLAALLLLGLLKLRADCRT